MADVVRIGRRSFLALAGTTVGAAALAACVPPATPAPTAAPEQPKPMAETKATEVPQPAQPKGKVLMQITQKQDVSEWIDQNLGEFKEMHPDIEVEIEAIPGQREGYFAVILAKAAADLLGDICWFRGSHGSHLRWAYMKIVRPLNDLADAEGYDWTTFFDGALEANRWEGKQWWMSYISEPVQPVLAINVSLAEERGVGMPDAEWTWDEFVGNWAEKVALEEGGRTKYFGLMPGAYDCYGAGNVLRSYKAELMDAEGTKCLFGDNDGLKQWLAFNQDNINQRKVSPSAVTGQYDANEEFLAGRLGALGIWPWFIQIWPEQIGDKFKVDFVEKPKGPEGDRRTMLNEHTLGLFQKSKNPQAAWEVLKWACGEEMCVRRVLDGMGGPNGQSTVWNNAEIIAKFPTYKLVADIMGRVEPDWRCANFRGEDVGPAFNQPVQAVLANEKTPEEAVPEIVAAVNEALQLPIA